MATQTGTLKAGYQLVIDSQGASVDYDVSVTGYAVDFKRIQQKNTLSLGPHKVDCSYSVTVNSGSPSIYKVQPNGRREYTADTLPDPATLANGTTVVVDGVVSTYSNGVLTPIKSSAYSVKCAILGDSISYNNTAGTNNIRCVGYMGHLMSLTNGRIYFDNSLNFGVAGNTSLQVLERLDAVIASGVDLCVVLVGTNDVFVGPVPFETTIANCEKIYRTLYAAGITPVIIPVLPRAKDSSSGNISSADSNKINRLARWQINFARDNGWVILADPRQNLIDFSSGLPIGGIAGGNTAITVDGLHPSQRGGYWIGKAIADALQFNLPDYAPYMTSAEAYDAVNNPLGNLVANPAFTGTSGTAGTGCTGQVATSYTAKRNVGSTGAIVASKQTKTLPNGITRPFQRFVFSAPSGAAIEEFDVYQTISSNITFGTDTLQMEAYVELSGITPDSLVYVSMVLFDGATYTYSNKYESNGYANNDDRNLLLRIPMVTPGSSATYVQPKITVRIDGTVPSSGLTLDVYSMSCVKR